MKIRTAKKVLAKWNRGLGHYTDRSFGVVIGAAQKVASYKTRRGWPTLAHGDILPPRWW